MVPLLNLKVLIRFVVVHFLHFLLLLAHVVIEVGLVVLLQVLELLLGVHVFHHCLGVLVFVELEVHRLLVLESVHHVVSVVFVLL